MKKLTHEEFVSRAKKIYGDRYDYEQCKYEHSLKKVIISCRIHGPFKIKPSNHINNRQGCWHCGNESTGVKQKRTTTEIVNLIQAKPNSEAYDFSSIVGVNDYRSDLVTVVCKEHGSYERTVRDILRSKYFGCKKCKIADDTFTREIFIEKSSKTHDSRYSYDKVRYTKAHDPVVVTCPEHGDFVTAPYIHIKGGGFCPICVSHTSSYEIELADYIKNQFPDLPIKTTCKEIEGVSEVDIMVYSAKVALELDGLYWHSDIFKKKNYHLEKTVAVSKAGHRLIHIFEDEWRDKKDICKSMVANALGQTKTKIHARSCSVREVPSREASDFLQANHIQGRCASLYRYGLYKDEILVALMTFGGNRVCLGAKKKLSEYELLRFCNARFTSVVGGASKIFSHFVSAHQPQKVTSYCDKRWGTGGLYKTLGFKKAKDTPPNYFYVRGGKRFGRFGFRKNVLVAKGHDPNKTERQIMSDLGYNRIYDCGSMKFEWKRKQA